MKPARQAPSKTAKQPRKASKPTTPRPKAKRPREPQVSRIARARRILEQLHSAYADATCALRHGSAYELLVAVILSAQCTDDRVNKVTPALFARFPDIHSLAAAPIEEITNLIRSTGFFNNKARNLKLMAQRVCAHFDGQIPDEMESLLSLAGVARKTANCILGTWFGKNEGIVVDTHVGRLAQRLGLLTTARDDKDAVKIERDLMELIPREDWTFVSHALIEHGRRVCAARKPQCERCLLAGECPSSQA